MYTVYVYVYVYHIPYTVYDIGIPNLSVAPGVSQGIATDVALIALGINVASQQAGIKF